MTGYSITPEQIARSRAALTKALGGKKPKVVILSDTTILHGPLHDEGRALVQRILVRKAERNARERFLQQLTWGSVHTDGHGNVIPRELPEYWKSLEAAMAAGATVEHTRHLNKRDTLTVDGEPMTLAAGSLSWWWEAQLAEAEKFQAKLNIVAAKGLAATPSAPPVGPVRWACRP